MQKLQNRITHILISKSLTISIAESCTGGLISHRLTNIPGSSKYFKLGVVAYSNEAKESVLKVPKTLIKSKGVVSKEVAICLAKGVLKLSNSQISLGITGIAGPTGATKNKPVGLVYIGLVSKNKIICQRYYFKGNRLSIKRQACLTALKLLEKFIKEL